MRLTSRCVYQILSRKGFTISGLIPHDQRALFRSPDFRVVDNGPSQMKSQVAFAFGLQVVQVLLIETLLGRLFPLPPQLLPHSMSANN